MYKPKNYEMLCAITECHFGLNRIMSLELLSDEYIEMMDKIFLPLLEKAGERKSNMPLMKKPERAGLVSFFVDFSFRADNEKSLSAEKKDRFEELVERFEKHVLSVLYNCASGNKEASDNFLCPSYFDAVRGMMERGSGVLAEAGSQRGKSEGKNLIKKLMLYFDNETGVQEEIAARANYFRQ